MIIGFHVRKKQQKKESANLGINAVLKAIIYSVSMEILFPFFQGAICCHIKPGISLAFLFHFF